MHRLFGVLWIRFHAMCDVTFPLTYLASTPSTSSYVKPFPTKSQKGTI